MNGSVSPARVLQLIGGIGIVIASFLDWATIEGPAIEGIPDSQNGWDVGMLGLWQTIIGGIVAAVALIALVKRDKFAPGEVYGFEFEQAIVVIAFPVLLWNFGLQFDDFYGGLGLFIGWIAAAIVIGGSELQRRTFSTAA